MRRTLVGLVLIGLVATAPAMAELQSTIDLRWEAPPGCPQERDVRDRTKSIVGSVPSVSHLRAEGKIVRVDRRFRLDLEVRFADIVGTRSIESNSCEDLAGAAAVEIGLLVHSVEVTSKPAPTGTSAPSSPPVSNPGAAGSPSVGTDGLSSPSESDGSVARPTPEGVRSEAETEPKKTIDKEPEPKPEVEPEAEEPPPPETPRSWRALLQAPIAALGVGPLPSSVLGLGLAVGLEHARWQVQIRGLSWRRQNVPAPGFPGYGADVDRIGASLWTCREMRFSWLGLSPCLAAGMERVSATGTGKDISAEQQHAIGVSVGAGIQGRIHLARWIRLVAAVGGEIELVRPQISIMKLGQLDPKPALEPPDPPTPVEGFAPAALTATLGLEWAL